MHAHCTIQTDVETQNASKGATSFWLDTHGNATVHTPGVLVGPNKPLAVELKYDAGCMGCCTARCWDHCLCVTRLPLLLPVAARLAAVLLQLLMCFAAHA
jgi:hypothetical protein